ncbi:MAG: fibronectin type III domain-containing protein, partial [Bacteroidota bacterium]
MLVDFGASHAQNQYILQYPALNIVLRNTATTEYVSGANPAYEGITESPGGDEETCWIGIRGTSPINFTYGQRIKATWFNRSCCPRFLNASISLTDSTAIAGAVLSEPWYAMYDYDQGSYSPNIQPGERKTLFFNITNPGSVLSNGSPACEGNRFCVNICRRFYSSDAGDLVLEKIELTDDADLTPPNPPVNLAAEMVSLAAGEPAHAVRLTWQKPTDPAGAGWQHVSGISRYFIYRNGQIFDAIDLNWSEFMDDSLEYIDNSVLPGQSYTYAVTALDKAIKGRCPSWHNVATMRHGNESAQATASISVPSFGLTEVFDPFSGMQYLGKIKLDGVG